MCPKTRWSFSAAMSRSGADLPTTIRTSATVRRFWSCCPIIFAQAIMFIPITFIGFSNVNDAGGFLHAFKDHTSFWYNFVFAILIIVFTYFYTAITINPNQMAEEDVYKRQPLVMLKKVQYQRL